MPKAGSVLMFVEHTSGGVDGTMRFMDAGGIIHDAWNDVAIRIEPLERNDNANT